MLFVSPHAGLASLLRCVICFQSPVGPAQTSGGAVKELRIRAEDFASAATERLAPRPSTVMLSLPRQSVSAVELAGSSCAIAVSASAYSVKRILPSWVQASQLAEALRLGVRLVPLPPPA